MMRRKKGREKMEFQTLKQSHLKRNIIIGVVAVLIISAIVLNFTRAKYRVTQSIPLVNGTINYSLADLNIVAITVDGESVDTIPEGNYELTEESYCTVNGEENSNISISYEADTQLLTVTPFTTKGTKCYLDFVTATAKKVDTVLGTIGVNLDTPNFASTSCTSGCGEATVGIYETTDNLGTSYYYRGDVENNYVQFAGYYWRIIRINGDGSIRIIYDGTSAHANGESSDDRQTGTSAYSASPNYNQSYYVGYMYQTGAQRPSSQNGGTTSTIKGVLDSRYSTNIAGKGYDDKVVSSPGFCNDRNTASGDNWVSSGTTFYYAPYERIYTIRQPSLQCSNDNDIYTTKVGLITADEVMYAGGTTSSNSSYYLYTGQIYWTMSPYYFNAAYSSASVFRVNSSGVLSSSNVHSTRGVRPVINIASNVRITGSGTISDPYVVS